MLFTFVIIILKYHFVSPPISRIFIQNIGFSNFLTFLTILTILTYWRFTNPDIYKVIKFCFSKSKTQKVNFFVKKLRLLRLLRKLRKLKNKSAYLFEIGKNSTYIKYIIYIYIYFLHVIYGPVVLFEYIYIPYLTDALQIKWGLM